MAPNRFDQFDKPKSTLILPEKNGNKDISAMTPPQIDPDLNEKMAKYKETAINHRL